MQPTQTQTTSTDGGFKPKYRHFAPNSTVWITNPYDKDVTFQVADEYNRPWQYRMPAHKVSELPGAGGIATLGVKALINRMIYDSPDAGLIWDEGVRRKYEDQVIQRVKETNTNATITETGEVDLSLKTEEAQTANEKPKKVPEEAFPGLKVNPLPKEVKSNIDNIVAASLPSKNADIKVKE